MKRKIGLSAFILIIVLIISGCIGAPVPASNPDNTSKLATMVEETIQSMQESVPEVTTSPIPPETEQATATLETSTPSLLPHALYFLAPGTNGKDQIWRMEKDGSGISVITAEANGITGYDISPSSGLIAYLTNNRIVITDNDWKNYPHSR